MAKEDYNKYKQSTDEMPTISFQTTNSDISAASVILSALIRSGTTKSAAPREAIMLLKELKKCCQEDRGSDEEK